MEPETDGSPIADVEATLTVVRLLSPVHALLTLRAPQIAACAQPGQFVHVRISSVSTCPLLRRPFSVAGVNLAAGTLRILVRAVGRGTEMLSGLLPGTELAVLGPLGRGFPDLPKERETVLVAGGVGLAPLLFFATSRGEACRRALYGAETAGGLVLTDELGAECAELMLATDDGSEGHHGFVTDLLPAALEGLAEPVVLACGPRPMMAAAARLCMSRALDCYVSFESWLGCGIGACLGCVIPAAGSQRRYVRVCRDGPVFPAEQVDWDALR
jgi:dihydroorotate dehydrogenase electron transfer subunit